jgi:hypothetical protein
MCAVQLSCVLWRPVRSKGLALQEFDLVITGCAKPAFFQQGSILFAVNPEDGTLTNTDNGAPILQIDKADRPSSMPSHPMSTHNSVRPSMLRLRWRIARAAPAACCNSERLTARI